MVADHGSTDETPDIIAKFRASYPNLHAVRVAFTRPARAEVRNAALRQSRGELVVFIDHDVLTPENFLREHAVAHAAIPCSLVAGTILGTTFSAEARELATNLELDHITGSSERVRGSPVFADSRLRGGFIPHTESVADLTQTVAPFRFFWGGNLSARRVDIEAAGTFDERYEGWGLEDDDFAEQFRRAGRKLAFAHEAWAFHVPTPSDGFGKLIAWRQNFERFFRKFPTRELECYAVHGPDVVPAAFLRDQAWLRALARIDLRNTLRAAAVRYGQPRGKRLGLFMPPGIEPALGLSAALCPFESEQGALASDARCPRWPLMGFKMPFQTGEFEEVIVPVDVVKWLDTSALRLILCEAARVARGAVLVSETSACDSEASAKALLNVRECLRQVRFEQLHWAIVSLAGEGEAG